jgi:hypothetical protein
LFYGAYQITADEIGMDIGNQLQDREDTLKATDRKIACEWIGVFARDPDVAGDNRMMVPIFHDIGRDKTKVWVHLGYSIKPLKIYFAKEPELSNKGSAEVEFKTIVNPLFSPVIAEIYVDKLLDREEFRSLCDKYKTRSAILNALKE